jgi:Domain of unknown function (DUF4920)
MLFALAACATAETRLGKPLTLNETIPLDKLLANPAKYVGKTVQVKGTVRDVCRMMGCWMEIADESGKAVRIKVNDGEIVFPKTAVGKTATAEGTFSKTELTREQALARARHEAEESGRKFDPASVKSGVTIYQIQGAGAVLDE